MRLSWLALAVFVAGCSTVDLDALERGDDVTQLRAELAGKARDYRIYVAPVAVISSEEFFPDERSTFYPMHVNREKLPLEIARCLEGVFASVAASTDAMDRSTDEAAAIERAKLVAYEKGCDVVLIPRITRFDAVFVDTTGWWWPNALFLAWYFYFPTWGIADEVYGVQAQLEYTVESLRNDRPLPGFANVPIVVDSIAVDRDGAEEIPRGPRVYMNDLDRGIDLLGTYRPGKLDKGQWAEHVQPNMEPYGRRAIATKLARDLAQRFEELEGNARLRARATAATHAVVVGIQGYRSGDPCPFADRDANAFEAWLAGEAVADDPLVARASAKRTPRKLVKKLLNDEATGKSVLAALEDAVSRSRPDDTIVFYFAGRGRSSNGGRQAADLGLVCSNATRQSVVGTDEVISLERLAKVLGRPDHARERVVILDTTFGTGARGADGQTGIDEKTVREVLAPLGIVVLASASKEPANVLQPEQHGLLTWALLDGALGAADPGHQGLTWAKLERHVQRTVEALSQLEGESRQDVRFLVPEPARKVLEPD